MKKIFLAVVVMASFAIGFLTMARAEKPHMNVVIGFGEEVTITGYGSDEFAVKGEVERQAKKMVEGWRTKRPVKIDIQGFADKTGRKAENDRVARDRASEMKAFLESRTDAKITARSKGDSENARKVVLTVYFAGVALVPESAVSAPIANSGRPMTAQALYLFSLCIGIAVAVVMFIFLVFVFPKIKGKATDKIQTATELIVLKDLAEEVPIDGYIFKIWYVAAEDRWYNQFKNNSGINIFAKTRKDIISSVVRCRRNGNFNWQFQMLLDSEEVVRAEVAATAAEV